MNLLLSDFLILSLLIHPSKHILISFVQKCGVLGFTFSFCYDTFYHVFRVRYLTSTSYI